MLHHKASLMGAGLGHIASSAWRSSRQMPGRMHPQQAGGYTSPQLWKRLHAIPRKAKGWIRECNPSREGSRLNPGNILWLARAKSCIQLQSWLGISGPTKVGNCISKHRLLYRGNYSYIESIKKVRQSSCLLSPLPTPSLYAQNAYAIWTQYIVQKLLTLFTPRRTISSQQWWLDWPSSQQIIDIQHRMPHTLPIEMQIQSPCTVACLHALCEIHKIWITGFKKAHNEHTC
jgi:hypothetical protein